MSVGVDEITEPVGLQVSMEVCAKCADVQYCLVYSHRVTISLPSVQFPLRKALINLQ